MSALEKKIDILNLESFFKEKEIQTEDEIKEQNIESESPKVGNYDSDTSLEEKQEVLFQSEEESFMRIDNKEERSKERERSILRNLGSRLKLRIT